MVDGGGVQRVSTRVPGPDHHSFPMLVDADAIVTARRCRRMAVRGAMVLFIRAFSEDVPPVEESRSSALTTKVLMDGIRNIFPM